MYNRDKSFARKHQSFQNGRTMEARRSNWSSGLFLCACPHNGNGRFGGDDAGGRASTTHVQLRPICAFDLRTSSRPLEFRDVCWISSTPQQQYEISERNFAGQIGRVEKQCST
ncbi:hypothetical protein WN48_02074 [Eufriesea mexicana]|nr:hypothetical protein WN48_02074 [Eufriesea mexicana]